MIVLCRKRVGQTPQAVRPSLQLVTATGNARHALTWRSSRTWAPACMHMVWGSARRGGGGGLHFTDGEAGDVAGDAGVVVGVQGQAPLPHEPPRHCVRPLARRLLQLRQLPLQLQAASSQLSPLLSSLFGYCYGQSSECSFPQQPCIRSEIKRCYRPHVQPQEAAKRITTL